MKKIISSFANSLLNKEQMKSVKGGTYYCNCGGGNPTANPDNLDCMYLCSGTTPPNNGYGLNGTPGPKPSQYNNPYNPGTPCIGTTIFIWGTGGTLPC